GTLELGALAKNSFSANDLDILSMIAGQAAVALNNALLYEAEQQRVLELSGLANLAQSIGAVDDPLDLFGYLTESIAPLLDVEVLGFLVYDENRRLLAGRAPFLGLPDDIISWYHVTIEPESPAEKIWLSQQNIVTENAVASPQLIALGLHDLAQVASIRSTALTPLTAGGRMLGYLQAGNKRDGSLFNGDDLRLLSIIAGQAGPIIENVTLVADARRRAQRAETLRRIASLTGSTATLDEILKYSLQDLARLLQADMARIWLLDDNLGALRLDLGSAFGFPVEVSGHFTRLAVTDSRFKETATGSLKTHISNNVRTEKALAVFQPYFDRFEVLSAIDVPLIVRERAIGEIVIASRQSDYFKRGDLQSAATVAAQLAAAIEQATLYSQTDQNLRQKVEQMTALTRISRELNSTLELERLLQRVYDETLRTTGADCGTILLFELDEAAESSTENRPVVLQLGDAPKNGLHPLEQVVLTRGEAVMIDDFRSPQILEGLDASTRIYPAHEGVCSALVVPIAYQDRVAGLIHLHANAPQRFDDASRQIGEALAVQAAIALGNAHRYQELRSRSEQLNRRVDTLSKLFETSQILQSEQPLESALGAIAGAIRASTPFDIVLISVMDPDTDSLCRVASAGIPPQAMLELQARRQLWPAISQLLTPEYCFGQTYFIPVERMPVLPLDVHTVTLLPEQAPSDLSAWHPEDLLLAPLYD
ncbi:MAG TPA: GAF domain-containing protein, partial [Anaerolineales bacterium]|nr:GAF domain-containing protein [Anaerolineales bacterium]